MKSSSNGKILLPPAIIGIVGGGQLGQMMALSAKSMGYKVGVFDPDADCPAGQVSDFQITAEYDNREMLLEFARQSDVLTYEFENVDLESLSEAKRLTELPQGTKLLEITGDRLNEKNFLSKHGIPVTKYYPIQNTTELLQGAEKIGYPSILKTVEGGYDGHGQQNLNAIDDLEAGKKLADTAHCILEKRQVFVKELSVMVTRSQSGKIQSFPVAENKHYHHILHKTIVPARISDEVQKNAQRLARDIAEALELRGVLGIEMFLLENGELMVNELAPRPHNSGHYSIEACNISQFEAHIRSICGLEIPEIKQTSEAVMVNLLGQHLKPARQTLIKHPDWHFHDYGKAEARIDRKMGHITLLGDHKQTLESIKSENIWEMERK